MTFQMFGDEAIDSFSSGVFPSYQEKQNRDFKDVGGYNEACSRPVIRLENNRFFSSHTPQIGRVHLRKSLLLDVRRYRLQRYCT